MNKEEKIWVIKILLVICFPFTFYFSCQKLTDLQIRERRKNIQELSFCSVVIEKQIDSLNRMNRYFVFRNNDEVFKLSENYYRINLDTMLKEINIGDSIIKKPKECRLMKIQNKLIDTFWFNNF